MEYEPQMYWEPSLHHENMIMQQQQHQDCYQNYQVMAANGEYVMTTGRDFLEYPEIDYEDCYLGDDDLSYGGSSDDDDCCTSSAPSSEEHHPSLNNNITHNQQQQQQQQQQKQQQEGEIVEEEGDRLSEESPVLDESDMDPNKKQSSHYPPPPLSKPPRLHKKPQEHRSPPAGGSRRCSSPTSSGNRKSQSPPETKLSSSMKSPPHVATPPGTSPSSSPPTTIRSNSTTPTNELGERGSPAGSSSSNNSISKSKIPKSVSIESSGRGLGSSSTPSFHGSVKTLYTDTSKRQSPPRLSAHLPPDHHGNYRLFKPTKHPGFTRRHTVSVADRIAQFGGQRKGLHRTFSPDNNRGGPNVGGIGGLDPYKDIDVEDKQRHADGGGKMGVVTDGHINQVSSSDSVLAPPPLMSTSTSTGTVPVTVAVQPSTTYPPQSESRQDDLVSPTSSIEELSLINNQRRDLVHKSHDSIAPPTNVIHKSHDPIAPPTNQPYRVVLHPHPVGGGYSNSQGPIHSTGSTFLPRPPQPHAANVLPSSTVVYSYPSSDHHGEAPPPGGGTAYLPVVMKNSSQPLGIATANQALAQNAAAKGEIPTLRSLMSNNDLDPVCCNHFGSNLLHTAAGNGQLQVLQLLSKEVSPTAFQVADSNYLTPAMLAIQGGHVECLKWLIEEGGVSLTVPDAGGETLLHHAAFNGQVVCLDYLLHRLDTSSEQVSYFDESGVTPAHFAAQKGHIDCLSLLINYNYDVIMPDQENQKPSDWADAMGHRTCTHYLLMYEMCWQLSREVAMLSQQVQRLYYDNEQLFDALKSRDKEHSTEMAQLLKQHQVTIQKVHEKYANYTVSLLLNEGKDQSNNVGVASTDTPPSEAKVPTSTNHQVKNVVPGTGTGPEHGTATDTSHLTSGGNKEKKERSKPPPLEIPPATPDEVLKRQLSNVEQQLFANRQVRKLHPVMATRSFSPLSPVLKKMSLSQEKLMDEALNSNDKEKRSVTFAPSVTEYIMEGSPPPTRPSVNPPHLHKSNSAHILTHSSPQYPVLSNKPSSMDGYHDNPHQPHPHSHSFHGHSKQYQYSSAYQPPQDGPSANQQQPQRPHSQSVKFGTKEVKSKQGLVKGKENINEHKEDKQQSNIEPSQQSSKHVGNKQPHVPCNTGSRGNPQHDITTATPTNPAPQKNTQLQQQLMKLQQLENNQKQSKQDIGSVGVSTRPDKPSQHVVHQQRGTAGHSILYRPVEGGGHSSGKKRASMPLPMATPPHPSPHHRVSLPMQRVMRTNKDMQGGLPSGVQPHPLTVSQGAGNSSNNSRPLKHNVSYK